MPQIVSGQSGYLGGETNGTGSGVGAVIFDKPDDSGSNMLFQAIQNNARMANEQQQLKRKENNEKQLAMLQGIDIDTKGVFEPDLPYFQEKTKEIADDYAKMLGKYNGDLSSTSALQEMNALKTKQALLKLEAQQSASDKDLYGTAVKRQNDMPTKYDSDKTWKNFEAYKGAKLGQRGSVQLLAERPPVLMEIMDKHAKSIGEDMETTEPITDKFGKVTYTTTKGRSAEKVNQAMQTLYQTDTQARAVADESFNSLPEDEKAIFKAQQLISGQESTPIAQLWMGKLGELNYATNKKGIKSLGNNMFVSDQLQRGRMDYGQQLKNQTGSLIFETTSAYANGETSTDGVEITGVTPTGLRKAQYNPATLNAGVFSVYDEMNQIDVNIQNTFLGTLVEEGKIANGDTRKFVRKIDTKTLYDLGIIDRGKIVAQNGVLSMDALPQDVKQKIFNNLDKFPIMNASDAIFIAKANGATDKSITETAKKYGATNEGGFVDLSKVNPKKTETKVNAGKFKPATTQKANTGAKTVPLIKSKAEFDKLPKGAKYTKSDGKTYVKG